LSFSSAHEAKIVMLSFHNIDIAIGGFVWSAGGGTLRSGYAAKDPATQVYTIGMMYQ
jgi:hypothetical protein